MSLLIILSKRSRGWGCIACISRLIIIKCRVGCTGDVFQGQFSMIFWKRECMLKSLQMCNNCILQSMMVWEGLQHHEHQWKNCFTVDWLETLIFYIPNFIIILIRFLNDFSQSFTDSLNQIMCVCEPPYDQWELNYGNSSPTYADLYTLCCLFFFVIKSI